MSAIDRDRAELDKYRELSVGEILRRARVKAGYEIEPIGIQLNIRPELLSALERNDYERLPGRVYVVGFVRTYAEALGLDGDKVVYLLKSQAIGHQYSGLESMPRPYAERRLPGPLVIGGSLGGLVLLLILWAVFAGGDGKPDIPEPPPLTEETTKP